MHTALLVTSVIEMIRALVILELLCLSLSAHAEAAGKIVPETIYDFGTVKQGSTVAYSFAVVNSATTPQRIKSVQFSIPGMTARFRPVVAPGSESKISIEWDTSHLSGEMDAEATVLFGDDPERRETLLLKGVVQPPLEVLPYPAIFLSAFHGEDKEIRLKIVNHEEAPIAVWLSAAKSKHLLASLKAIQPGKVYELAARIPADALPGRYDAELHLSTDNAKVADLSIPVHVFVKADVYANPETIDFGAVSAAEMQKSAAAREMLTQTFLVKKRGGEFEIKDVQSDMDALEVTKDPATGQSATYRIKVALNPDKMKPGRIAGSVKLFTDDKNFPIIRVPVSGTIH